MTIHQIYLKKKKSDMGDKWCFKWYIHLCTGSEGVNASASGCLSWFVLCDSLVTIPGCILPFAWGQLGSTPAPPAIKHLNKSFPIAMNSNSIKASPPPQKKCSTLSCASLFGVCSFAIRGSIIVMQAQSEE